jgi:hypothetical protein
MTILALFCIPAAIVLVCLGCYAAVDVADALIRRALR